MYKTVLRHISRNATARGLCRMLYNYESPELRREVMDLDFRNSVGVAPGFDRNSEFYNAAGAFGCGFAILGPLSFERTGGIRAAVAAVRANPANNLLIGFDITKTPGSVSEDDIAKDFLDAFDYGYDFADFTVLDFSDSGMGPVRDDAFLKAITDPILEARMAYDSYHPVMLRLCSALKSEELIPILDYCLMNGIDGVLAPGEPLVRQITDFSKGRLPIIAESRIGVPSKAAELIAAGASLVAIQCTPARFKPALQKAILKTIKKK